MLTYPKYSIEVRTTPDIEDGSPAPSTPKRAQAPQEKTLWPIHDLALVFVCVCLLVGAIFVAWQRSAHIDARDQLIADFTAAEEAFLTHLQIIGKAPADAPPGRVPAGMQPYLAKFDWEAPSALGGHFRWSPLPPPVNLAATKAPPPLPGGTVTLTAFPPSPPLRLSFADLLEIDRRIDDGDLATGKLRIGFNGWPVLTVLAKR
jgi:hypothetical protein